MSESLFFCFCCRVGYEGRTEPSANATVVRRMKKPDVGKEIDETVDESTVVD